MGAAIHYGRVRSARMLASLDGVDLAVVGEVAGYEPAELKDCGGGQTIMYVTPTDVFVGAAPSDGPVEVLLLWTGRAASERLAEALPIGSPVVVYTNTINDCRPRGEHYVPVSPQGFITEDDDGSIFPYDAGLNSGAPLRTQVPAGVAVP